MDVNQQGGLRKQWLRFLMVGLLFLFSKGLQGQNRVLYDGGFEAPLLGPTDYFGYMISEDAPDTVAGTRMGYWSTSAPNYIIEYRKYLAASPKSEYSAVGDQHAELNATNAKSRLFQNTCLINGETIYYSLYHRGRSGPDTLQVNLYDANGTSKLAILKTLGTDSSDWQPYGGSHTVSFPSGIYQFSFESLYNFGNKPHEGSLLDEIDITMAPLVTFSKPAYTELEDNPTVPMLKVNGRVPAGGMTVTVGANTIGASIGKDYTFTTTVFIPQGTYTPQLDSFPFAFNVLSDQIKENDEEITFTIQSATNGGLVNAGCGGYLSSTYTIVNDDLFEAGPIRSVCPKETITLHAVGSESPTWDNGAKQDISFAAPILPGDYLYIAKDTSFSEPTAGVPFFLPMSDTVMVTVRPAPQPITKNIDTCQESGVSMLTAIGTPLLWYIDTLGPSSNISPSVDWGIPDTMSVWVSQVTNGCESAKQELKVSVRFTPVAPLVDHITLCQQLGNITLTAPGNGITWYNVPLGGTGSSVDPSFDTNVPVSTSLWASRTVSLCEGPRAEAKVLVHPLPLAPNVSDAMYCLHDLARPLTTLQDSLFWYTSAIAGTRSSIVPTVNTNMVAITSHWLSIVKNGCEGPRSTLNVTVNDLPLVKINGIVSGSYCAKSTLTFSATGANQYDWTLPSGLQTSQTSISIPSFGIIDNGKYLLVGTDMNQCIVKDSVVLSMKNPPAVSATPLSLCEKAPIKIEATTTGTAYWRLPNQTIQNSAILSIPISAYSDKGKYVVISTENGCTDSIAVTISVSNCLPVAQNDFYFMFRDQKLIMEGSNHPISNDTDPNDLLQAQDLTLLTTPLLGQLTWEGNGLLTYTAHGEAEGKEIIEYQICDRGTPVFCDTARIEIEIKKRNAFFPDAFSPNGDGINDTYTVYQLSPDIEVELDVYNRWGDLVFQDKAYKNDWKGTCTGTMCNGNGLLPVGTYFIVAKLSNGDMHSTYLSLNR